MKTLADVLGWFAILILLAGLATAAAQEKVSGTYAVYSNGSIVATDDYTSIAGKRYSDEIRADTQKISIDLRYEDGVLDRFERLVNSMPGSSIKLNKIMLSFYEGTGMVGVLSNEEKFPVFEPSSYAEYAMFPGMLYDQAKGGKQSTQVVIPSLEDFLPVEIERHGSDPFAVGTTTINGAHYRVALGKKKETVNLWMDGDRMMAAYLAAGNKFIIDTRYDHLYDRVKQLINRAM